MSRKAKDTKQKNVHKKDASTNDSENIFTLIGKAIRSEQFPRVIAVFVVIFTVFCFISFVSFFFTWFSDYSIVQDLSPQDLLHGEKDIQNWGGSFGAFISYVFIRDTFGVGAFGFILLFAFLALKIFKAKITYFSRWIIATFVFMFWISCIFGYVVVGFQVEKLEDFAGAVGIGVNSWLCSFIGTIGCGLVHLAFTITIPMLLFGVKYLWVTDKIKAIKNTASSISINNNEEEVKEIEEKAKDDTIKETLIERARKEQENNKGEDLQEDDQEDPFSMPTPQPSPIIKKQEDKPISKEEELLNNFTVRRVNEQPNDNQEEIVEDNTPFIVNRNQANEKEEDNQEEEDNEEQEIEHIGLDTPYDPHLDLPHYVFPTTDLLIDYEKGNKIVTDDELLNNKARIIKTLKNYSIEINSITATTGPTVTLYEIVPAPGIRISRIKNLEDDIALSLSAFGIRIIAPIPGKGTIGIEVPNSNPQIVSMKSMLESSQFLNNKYDLPIAIGKTIDNKPFVTDLAKMPHLLMAGATGQGKSVGLNAIITSLLYKKHPSELKFIMVDPKKVELSLYSKLDKHYLAKLPDSDEAIITDVKNVVRTLKSLCKEMDTRYDLLKDAGCKKITEYNNKFISRGLNPNHGHRFMPYIVLVIDEFADLIMTAGKEIEMPICRLAQLARAVGIHLIIATQRPSVNIITGSIKANFPARAAFKVSSKIDSRTILDFSGAEQLVGRGDMLLYDGRNGLIRLQCALIDTEEIEKINDFIGEQRGYDDCFLLPDCPEESNDSDEVKEINNDKLDEKFEEAARLIVAYQQGSTSFLQRKLALGYNRAGRVMDQLQANGIVGEFQGSKAREVLVKTDAELDDILNRIFGR